MINIAIDGYSSTGKSTMARTLASEIGYRYIDSGAMYRAVTLFALRNDMIDPLGNIEKKLLIESLPDIHIDFKVGADKSQVTMLNGEVVEAEIREMTVSSYVSVVAAIPEVREAMVDIQRKLGENGGVVMDGRDIGTTVFPGAALKVFVTASPEVRARRRFLELEEKGEKVKFEEVLENVRQRDYLDETREVSPLRRASDAKLLDNTDLTPQQQNSILLQWAKLAIEEARS